MATREVKPEDASATNDIVVPSTPPPQPVHKSHIAEMTPPPSTQPPKTSFLATRSQSAQRNLFPRSPPSTTNDDTQLVVPTPENIAKAGPDELRKMAQELAHGVAEARMSAAHFKLQHRLLTIECQEAALRAEIERQMTRREVEVLQGAEHHRGVLSTTSQTTQSSSQLQVDALVRTCKELMTERDEAKSRVYKAKKIIEEEIDKVTGLVEENLMLKTRIRENRQHLNMMRRSPYFFKLALPPNEFATPQRRSAPQFPGSARSQISSHNQDPFAALLAADQVLSGEAATVPSTPTKAQSSKYHQGHTRGAFSLSSLQTVPAQSRPLTAGEVHQGGTGSANRLAYSAPNTQAVELTEERDRRDRDSTISVSDHEALTDDDLPQSQASSLATNMLRRNPGHSIFPGQAEKSSKVLQTKLFGQVKKAGTGRKRHASFGETVSSKKAKLMEEVVGLGIGGLRTPRIR